MVGLYVIVMFRNNWRMELDHRLNSHPTADAAADRRHCVLRTVGRAGCQSAGSRRYISLRDGVLRCSSAEPVSRRTATRKPAVQRIQPESTKQNDIQFDSLMKALSLDHAGTISSSLDDRFLNKSNHRRSSLPMDYRSLAGMTQKCCASVKKQKLFPKQQETANMGKSSETTNFSPNVTVSNSSDKSPALPGDVVFGKKPGHNSKIESPKALLTAHVVNYQVAGFRDSQYTAENMGRTCVLESSLPDRSTILQAPLAQVWKTESGEDVLIIYEDKQTKTVEHDDKGMMSSVRHCDSNKLERESAQGGLPLSDLCATMYKGAVRCSSTCDCFSFCDLLSAECRTDTLANSKVDVDGLVMCAVYIGCDDSRKVTCDLHLVGALETASHEVDSATSVVGRQLCSAAVGAEHEEFVDNICVDCGCELTCDGMAQCAFSVPICSICSQDANHNVPSSDSIMSTDHGYACLPTSNIVLPTPPKANSPSSAAVHQHTGVAESDVVDGITFLSFPSKPLMHKYISYQQYHCDLAVKSSWAELARCERTWHNSHRSHQRLWFGNVRHRHINRYSTHCRLNEQIELGLVKSVSALNSPDLLGITLKTSQNQAAKTVVGRKLKRRHGHILGDVRIERPTRLAARGHHYCLTRFRRKGNAVRTLAATENVDVTKLTQRHAEEALQMLSIPPIITLNSCSQPGIFILHWVCLPLSALKLLVGHQ